MAQRFQCGLLSTYATQNSGRFFHRWLVEWLTQVVGWTLVDKSVAGTSNWSNVAASGSTCSSTTSNRIEITSPGYVFSAASEGGFLTLTGFGAPFQTRDGIYKIKRYIGVVGNVYTVELDTDFGVHSDGIPIGHSGLVWRFWLGTDAYCPSTTSDWAVVGGKGKTGAGLSIGTGTGDTLDAAAGVVTLTDATANFQTSDVGKSVTIVGATTVGHNGTFTIASRISATQITWANGAGGLPASEAFPGTWTITYVYHVHFKAQTTAYGWGEMRLSPFGSWNAGTHTWSDSRYTTAVVPPYAANSYRLVIYAEADTDHFLAASRCLSQLGTIDNLTYWQVWAAGELDPFYPETDPRPCYVWAGCDNGAYNYEYGGTSGTPLFGYSSYSGFRQSFYALAFDDLTTTVLYAIVPGVMPSYDLNPTWSHKSKVSTMPGNQFYRTPVILECRTSGFMELRGVLRQAWACSASIPVFYQQGASGEYVSPLHGLLIPWNNSRNALPEVGSLYPVG